MVSWKKDLNETLGAGGVRKTREPRISLTFAYSPEGEEYISWKVPVGPMLPEACLDQVPSAR
jgi:hypothetical protein